MDPVGDREKSFVNCEKDGIGLELSDGVVVNDASVVTFETCTDKGDNGAVLVS